MSPEKVLPALLARRAAQSPDRPFLSDSQGVRCTYRETHDRVLAATAEVAAWGVQPGDAVATLLGTSVDAVVLWLATAALGAVEVPLNTGYRGELLQRLLDDAGARVLVTEPAFLPHVEEVIDSTGVELLVVIDPTGLQPVRPRQVVIPSMGLRSLRPAEPLAAADETSTACLMYTSGTTGRSKGVRVTWTQLYETAMSLLATPPNEADCSYIPAPMFHVGGKAPVYLTALTGGQAVLRPAFKTNGFWADVEEHGCTVTYLGAAMANFLLESEGPPAGQHPLRDVLMAPAIPRLAQFRERFGVRVCTAYNMTEVSCPLVSGWLDDYDGSCGVPREGYECRILDENDQPVPEGVVGELVVRNARPWTLFNGYWRQPEATVEAWRNLWFHTGDAFKVINGRYYFVDRFKDAIRRRGENISSAELEELACRHPGVAEAAAVAVASEYGEEEVLVFVRLAGDHPTVTETALLDAWATTMPGFMVPRYVEIIDDFPRTPNAKVIKALLRERGIGPATWDSRRGTKRSTG